MNQVCFDCGRESPMPEAGGPPLCPHCGSSFVTPLADSSAPKSPVREPPRKSVFLPGKEEGGAAPDDPFASLPSAPAEGATSELPLTGEPFGDLVPSPSAEPAVPEDPLLAIPAPPESAPAPRPRERRTSVAFVPPPPPPKSGVVPILVAPAAAAAVVLVVGLVVAVRMTAPPTLSFALPPLSASPETGSGTASDPLPKTPGAGLPIPSLGGLTPAEPTRVSATPKMTLRFEAASMYSAPQPARWSIFARNVGPATATISVKAIKMTYICGGTTTPQELDQPMALRSIEIAPGEEGLLARIDRPNRIFKCKDAGSATVTEAVTVSSRIGEGLATEETARVVYKVY